jgi:hypothetical protein
MSVETHSPPAGDVCDLGLHTSTDRRAPKMHAELPTHEAERFYASTCPVCKQRALEARRNLQIVEIECAGCGSFGIAATVRPVIGKLPEAQRRKWLDQARSQSLNEGIAVVNFVNESKVGRV